jgi:hypothetical protein
MELPDCVMVEVELLHLFWKYSSVVDIEMLWTIVLKESMTI